MSPSPGPGAQSNGDRRGHPRTDAATCAHHDAVYTLARASEAHDPDTGDHVLRIRRLVESLASEMGMIDEEACALGYDAMLHDVGKLMVPRWILQKPTPLTESERLLVQAHTLHGQRLLADRPTMGRAATIARSHHEWFDGSGYPDGLAGEAIPVEARITAVADVMDALMSPRAYKHAWTPDQAVARMRDQSGVHLDPHVAAALGRCHQQGVLAEVYGQGG